MTVNEMHIAVNLGVQKLASFQADNLLPEEIDYELNLATMRFIKQRYNASSNKQGKGFEQSQKRIDDLKHLVVENAGYTISHGVDSDSLGGYTYTANNTNIYIDRYTLPLDYLFLVSVKAQVFYECNTTILEKYTPKQNNINIVKLDITPPLPGYFLTSIEVWSTASNNFIQFTNTPLGEELTRDILINPNSYFTTMPGFRVAVNDFIGGSTDDSAQRTPPLDSNTLYLQRIYPFEVDPSTGYYIRLTWINAVEKLSNPYYQLINSLINSQTTIWRTAPTATKRLSSCKYAQHDDLVTMMDDPFNITDYRIPIYTIQENYIDVHTDNTFVVPQVFIRYIRKPKDISLATGTGSELPVHTHDEIVEMAVKSILEGIEAQRYQSQSMETFESE
jgi:hypothetical protein